MIIIAGFSRLNNTIIMVHQFYDISIISRHNDTAIKNELNIIKIELVFQAWYCIFKG